jgi:hypothetical protein
VSRKVGDDRVPVNAFASTEFFPERMASEGLLTNQISALLVVCVVIQISGVSSDPLVSTDFHGQQLLVDRTAHGRPLDNVAISKTFMTTVTMRPGTFRNLAIEDSGLGAAGVDDSTAEVIAAGPATVVSAAASTAAGAIDPLMAGTATVTVVPRPTREHFGFASACARSGRPGDGDDGGNAPPARS